jgi:glycolate oxidase FAD binding subunit
MTEAGRAEFEAAVSALIGDDRLRAPSAAESSAALLVAEPESIEQVAEIVRLCEGRGRALAPIGMARTLSQLRRTPVALGLSLARLNKVIAYEPDDMTITVQAGALLDDLNRHMADRRQWLPVDPPSPSLTTTGAAIGGIESGPFRLSQGTVRDLLIGIQFVGGGGRIVRAGGRVVKNVAGYDLMKLMTGSFGTLGIVTEATFKVRPLPENYSLLRVSFKDGDSALTTAAALNDALPLLHLEVLSPKAATTLSDCADFLLLAGLAGNEPELRYQLSELTRLVGSRAEIEHNSDARQSYERLRDFVPSASLVAQAALPPASLPRFLAETEAEFQARPGSGVAQLFADPVDCEEIATTITRWRERAVTLGGHLRVTNVPQAPGAEIDLFGKVNNGAMKLMTGLKQRLDPARIFNPGCFVGGL